MWDEFTDKATPVAVDYKGYDPGGVVAYIIKFLREKVYGIMNFLGNKLGIAPAVGSACPMQTRSYHWH